MTPQGRRGVLVGRQEPDGTGPDSGFDRPNSKSMECLRPHQIGFFTIRP
jgi:hypothetical protein